MSAETPFVITLANEKGGVGKTTIATNLAIYLKALREDLNVTILSFDNHFSIEQMYAIGAPPEGSVADIFTGTPMRELARLGEYGVSYIPSCRTLNPDSEDPYYLARRIAVSGLGGVVIIDTRPVIDYCTESALLAADLVLVPVKDRTSLVNASSLVSTLHRHGESSDRLHVLASIIDSRQHLPNGMGVGEFLLAGALEREYRTINTPICESPKVGSLNSGLSSKILPVLLYGRGTQPFSQFRELAQFVLDKVEGTANRRCQGHAVPAVLEEEGSDRPVRNLKIECPVCNRTSAPDRGYFFEDMASRTRGFIHLDCLAPLIDDLEKTGLPETGMLIFETGFSDQGIEEGMFRRHLIDAEGEESDSSHLDPVHRERITTMIANASGRPAGEFFRDMLLIPLETETPARFASSIGYRNFALRRRDALRTLRENGEWGA